MASESINDFAIKLGVDATGVATGMKAANAIILQSQREVLKAEAVEREINIQQKMDAEDKFNKWYASEQEREFQAWYKLEQQKETVLQEQNNQLQQMLNQAASDRQQTMVNTYNAAVSNERRLTTAIEEETQKQLAFSRQLQEAVIARYAAQDAAEQAAINKADTETQGVMDAAWERIVAQQRKTLEAFYADKDRMASESAAHTLRVTEQERRYQEEQDAERIKALREDMQARAQDVAEQLRLSRETADTIAALREQEADHRRRSTREQAEMIARLAEQEIASVRRVADETAAQRQREADERQRSVLAQRTMIDNLAAHELEITRRNADAIAYEREREADARIRDKREQAEMIARGAAEEASILRNNADRLAAQREAEADERQRLRQQQLQQEASDLANYQQMQERRVAAAFRAQKRIEEDARRFRAGAGAGDMQESRVGGRIPISEETIRRAREYVREVEMMNRLEQEAIGLKRQLMTAEQLHTARVAEYDAMLSRNILTQQEHAAAVAYSTRIAQASTGGFGGTGAAITQASYAAEDFIQVLSMGGGLNMALMSASNNLSMVARSVLGTNAAMGALAGFGVPALLIGLGMLVRYLMDTEDASEKAKKALEDFRKETEHLGEMTKLRFEYEDDARRVQETQDRAQLEQEITDLKLRQVRLDETMAMEEMKRAGANAEYFEGLMGGQEALIEFELLLQDVMRRGNEEQKLTAEGIGIILEEARQAALAGNEQAMLHSLRMIHTLKGDFWDQMNPEGIMPGIPGLDIDLLDRFKAFYNDPKLIDSLQTIFDPDLLSLQENLELQKTISEELVSQQEHMTKERKEQLEIAKQMLIREQRIAEIQGTQTRERQQRMRNELEMLRMSEAEREMRRLQDERAAFMDNDTGFVGPELIAREFMDLQLEQVQKEIEQLRKPGYAQGLEQNTYDAQAKAFDQMFKAQFGPRDAQVERLDTLIEINRQLVEQGAQAPRVNVVPGG